MSKSPFNTSFTVGILGGGQLGKMLIQSAMNFGIRIVVLDPDEHAPCRNFCDEFTRGLLTDASTVYNFGKSVDVLTIEIENVSVPALQRLQSEGIPVFPQPEVIKTIQDKGLQKLFLREQNIPTTDFELVENREELESFDRFFPLVQKLRRTGYDGRGVVKINSPSEIGTGFDQPSVLEEFAAFEKEIAVIAARNAKGEVRVFPAIEMVFHPGANLVDYLFSPARISRDVELNATGLAIQIMQSLSIVGLAAVEMFIMNDGKVLVNEIAPRPHNSGHHTIEANVTSQFEQHLRAILNLPLGSTAMKSPAVMVNILGEEGCEGIARYQGIEGVAEIEGASIHLYGKQLTKPFRKMGHVTIVDTDLDRALAKAKFIKQQIKVIV